MENKGSNMDNIEVNKLKEDIKEQISIETKKVSIEIIDKPLHETTLEIVNNNRRKENKEELKNLYPIKAYSTDAAYDIFATSYYWDDKNDCWVYGCNLRIEPPINHKLTFVPRSSNRRTECYIPNSPATGDYGYRNEYIFCFKPRTAKVVRKFINICVDIISSLCSVTGLSRQRESLGGLKYELRAPYELGERMVQMECVPIYNIEFIETKLSPEETERGNGGHGSSGK